MLLIELPEDGSSGIAAVPVNEEVRKELVKILWWEGKEEKSSQND